MVSSSDSDHILHTLLLDEQCKEMVQWNNQHFVNNIKIFTSLSFELEVLSVVSPAILESPFDNQKVLF